MAHPLSRPALYTVPTVRCRAQTEIRYTLRSPPAYHGLASEAALHVCPPRRSRRSRSLPLVFLPGHQHRLARQHPFDSIHNFRHRDPVHAPEIDGTLS